MCSKIQSRRTLFNEILCDRWPQSSISKLFWTLWPFVHICIQWMNGPKFLAHLIAWKIISPWSISSLTSFCNSIGKLRITISIPFSYIPILFSQIGESRTNLKELRYKSAENFYYFSYSSPYFLLYRFFFVKYERITAFSEKIVLNQRIFVLKHENSQLFDRF